MSESAIGIKIANGEFYPVIEGSDRISKKLVLTTVNDNQESVQIDLYRGLGNSIENASYIGSLLIEDLLPKESGEPDIELILGVDDEGNLNATASDRQSGDMQSLSVNLDTVTEPESYDLPDFDLNDDLDSDFEEDSLFDDVSTPDFSSDKENWDTGVTAEEETVLTGKKTKKGKVHPLLLLAFIVAGLAIIGLLIILLLRSIPGEDTPPLQAENGQVQTAAEAEPVPEKPAEPSAPAETPAVASEAAAADDDAGPADEPAEEVIAETASSAAAAGTSETSAGFWYDIKYGDTLWDLSNAFYRTPWLYGKLARENNIKDPDLIYWGTQLYIPE